MRLKDQFLNLLTRSCYDRHPPTWTFFMVFMFLKPIRLATLTSFVLKEVVVYLLPLMSLNDQIIYISSWEYPANYMVSGSISVPHFGE